MPKNISSLKQVIWDVFRLREVVLFSIFINLLMLTPTFFMLEVYGRVVTSRNQKTLLMLLMLVVGLYLILELLEWVRLKVMYSSSLDFDKKIRKIVFSEVFSGKKINLDFPAHKAFDDLRVLREALYSQGCIALLDAPLAIITLVFLFIIHPRIGWFAVIGISIQLCITYFNQKNVAEPMEKAAESSSKSQSYAVNVSKNAEVIKSMDMIPGISSRWGSFQESFLKEQANASYIGGNFSAISKMTQGLMGSLILGLGCLLAIEGSMDPSGSTMIAGSILMGRAMQPLVQIIMQWKSLNNANQAYKRLSLLVKSTISQDDVMDLPSPTGMLTVDNVTVSMPKVQVPVLMGIGFELKRGEILAVMGPSASGKTTLTKVIVGACPVNAGKVRLDGADIKHWKKENLGPFIGYLPQSIELFEGSLADNIARFGELDQSKIVEASKWVGLDEIISKLPDGYETQVGIDGSFLSGGMRQRIGLARAIYGLPRIIVLDEPNSSLDAEGESAFLKTLQFLKQSQCTVVLVTHRSNVMQYVDKIMILVDGRIKALGPRDEVISSLNAAAKAAKV